MGRKPLGAKNMIRFISNSYGLCFILVAVYAILQNSLFVIYIAMIALAAGLHYIEANIASIPNRFKGRAPLGFARIANGLHIIANLLLVGLVIRELLVIL